MWLSGLCSWYGAHRWGNKKSSYSKYVHFGVLHHTNCWWMLCLATMQIVVILLMGVAVAKMTLPCPSFEWHFALYRPSWCSCNVLWKRKGRTGGRGWLLHQADKAWPCVSSVVEGPWLAPGGLLLSMNLLRKLLSLLVGPTFLAVKLISQSRWALVG